MDSNTWLQIYMEAKAYFEDEAYRFLKSFHELSWCEVGDPYDERTQFYYCSEVLYQFSKKLRTRPRRTSWMAVDIPETSLEKILRENYPEGAVFAVAFAAWWPLPMDKICFLIDLPGTHPEIRPKDVLNYFLCEPEVDIPENLSVCEHYRYRGTFYRYESEYPEDGQWIDYGKMDPAFLKK